MSKQQRRAYMKHRFAALRLLVAHTAVLGTQRELGCQLTRGNVLATEGERCALQARVQKRSSGATTLAKAMYMMYGKGRIWLGAM